MIAFYCVGFHDLSYTWNRFGHVCGHEIFMTEDEAKKANSGLVTMVHEFYVGDQKSMDRIIECNKSQRINMGLAEKSAFNGVD